MCGAPAERFNRLGALPLILMDIVAVSRSPRSRSWRLDQLLAPLSAAHASALSSVRAHPPDVLGQLASFMMPPIPSESLHNPKTRPTWNFTWCNPSHGRTQSGVLTAFISEVSLGSGDLTARTSSIHTSQIPKSPLHSGILRSTPQARQEAVKARQLAAFWRATGRPAPLMPQSCPWNTTPS